MLLELGEEFQLALKMLLQTKFKTCLVHALKSKSAKQLSNGTEIKFNWHRAIKSAQE